MSRAPIRFLVVGLSLLVTGLAPGTVSAQSAQSASLVGKVTDESGGAMPGVTVTVTSPALQVPQLTTVTNNEGDYRLLELPPGVYKATFELSGFQTSARTDLHLTVGFSARVDAVMKIGAVSETIEVSGQSPVVDTVSTHGQTTLLESQLRSVPMGGTMQEMLPLAAGVSMQSKPDVGDSNLALRSSIVTYGVVLQTTLDVEGVNTVTDHAADTAVYLNSFSLEEAQFKTSGNNADVAFPGVAQVAVLKSGSNTLSGLLRLHLRPWRPDRSRQAVVLWRAEQSSRHAGADRICRCPERRRLLAGELRRHDAGGGRTGAPSVEWKGVLSTQRHDQADCVGLVCCQTSVVEWSRYPHTITLHELPAPAR
jgi:hypothetical protein